MISRSKDIFLQQREHEENKDNPEYLKIKIKKYAKNYENSEGKNKRLQGNKKP